MINLYDDNVRFLLPFSTADKIIAHEEPLDLYKSSDGAFVGKWADYLPGTAPNDGCNHYIGRAQLTAPLTQAFNTLFPNEKEILVYRFRFENTTANVGNIRKHTDNRKSKLVFNFVVEPGSTPNQTETWVYPPFGKPPQKFVCQQNTWCCIDVQIPHSVSNIHGFSTREIISVGFSQYSILDYLKIAKHIRQNSND